MFRRWKRTVGADRRSKSTRGRRTADSCLRRSAPAP